MMPTAPHDIVLRTRAITEPAIRRAFLAREIASTTPEALAMLLGYLVSNVANEDVRVAWLDVVLTLLPVGDAPRDQGTAAAVVERLDSHPARGVIEFLLVAQDDRRGPDVVGDPYALDDVALGLRKASARRRSRDVLRQITADPDPSVIEILLANPLLVELEVIRIAARRPQVAAIFLLILQSSRFGVRESVQSTIVMNPWCPVRISLALLPLLSRQHRIEVAGSPTLDDRVRAAAAAMAGISVRM